MKKRKKDSSELAKPGIKRLLQLSAEKPFLLIAAIIFSSFAGVLMFAPYFTVYKVIEEVAYNYGEIGDENIKTIIMWVVYGVIAMAGGIICMCLGGICSHAAAFKILYGLRINLTQKLTALPMGFHVKHTTGEIRKILELNVEKIEQWIAHSLPDYVSGIVGFFVIIGLLFSYNVWLALIFVVVVIAGVIVTSRFSVTKKGVDPIKQYQTALEKINSSSVQYVRGMSAVKIFNHSAESFKTLNEDINNYADYSLKYCYSFRPVMTILLSLLKGIGLFILPASALILMQNPTSLEFALSVTMFLMVASGIVASIFKIVGVGYVVKEISGGVERIDMIFNAESLIEPHIDKKPNSFDVSFKNVSFSYNPNSEKVINALQDVSFTAKEGSVTALVGPSGGGKSTCAMLIPRFWDVVQGEICLGNVNIKDIKQESLNNYVSCVLQDSFLFYDTIYENIKAGVSNATLDDIIRVSKAAQCHDFIMAMQNGYDTVIGEGGIYLSGGEEQRINIARAMLKNSPILVLDEATAFADSENEMLLYKAIKELIKDKTVIMIAHRLSTIMNADNIVVIDKGVILENGKHDKLLQNKGMYSQLYNAYIQNTEWTVSK